MKDLKNIENELEQTLNSLRLITRAGPGPFFVTRVKARFNRVEKNGWEKLSALLSRPAIAIAGICLVILINTVTLVEFKDKMPSLAEQNESVYDEEYNMAVTSFYNIENTEP